MALLRKKPTNTDRSDDSSADRRATTSLVPREWTGRVGLTLQVFGRRAALLAEQSCLRNPATDCRTADGRGGLTPGKPPGKPYPGGIHEGLTPGKLFRLYPCGGLTPGGRVDGRMRSNRRESGARRQRRRVGSRAAEFWIGMAISFLVTVAASGQTTAESGIASWYGGQFHGRRTANGEVFDQFALSAAHKTLPFGSVVEVTNRNNSLSVVVRINDRGPFVVGRVIDLSRAAAEAVDLIGSGVAPVDIRVISSPLEHDLRLVQVASFGRHTNAAALVERLHAAGINATIEPNAASTLYRVVVPDVRMGELDALKSRLAAMGHSSVLVRVP